MTIKSIEEKPFFPIEIDLTGPDGNAFSLMGYAKRLARSLNKDAENIVSRMMLGDYENLITILEEEFGDYIVLYR